MLPPKSNKTEHPPSSACSLVKNRRRDREARAGARAWPRAHLGANRLLGRAILTTSKCKLWVLFRFLPPWSRIFRYVCGAHHIGPTVQIAARSTREGGE